MRYTIEALLRGSDKILEYYQTAKDKWLELFDGEDEADAGAWAKWIAKQEKGFFEKECGGNLIGTEIMAWSSFGSLYSTQFGFEGEKRGAALKLAEAFAASGCSPEAKDAARKAALSYGLDDKKPAASAKPEAATG